MPTILTPEAAGRARDAIKSVGRPLEIARAAVAFDDADPLSVLEPLSAFQNDDGGFGNALEPDFRLPDSSPMATSVAFQLFAHLEAPTDHPMVTRAVDYLVAAFNHHKRRWVRVPPTVADHPRAFWWQPEEANAPDGVEINVTAELVGHLWHFAHDRDDVRPLLESLTPAVTDLITAQPDNMEKHDLLCAATLQAAHNLPAPAREAIEAKLLTSAPQVIATTPEGWANYGLSPLWLAPTPRHFLAKPLLEAIEANLDYDIGRQGEDGAWTPPWDWSAADPGAWAKARADWMGILTLKALESFMAWGRLNS